MSALKWVQHLTNLLLYLFDLDSFLFKSLFNIVQLDNSFAGALENSLQSVGKVLKSIFLLLSEGYLLD